MKRLSERMPSARRGHQPLRSEAWYAKQAKLEAERELEMISGDASSVVAHIKDLPPDARVMAAAIVSSESLRPNLIEQARVLRAAIKRKKAKDVGIYTAVIPKRNEARLLTKLFAKAKRLKADYVLLETSCRIIRNKHFNPTVKGLTDLSATDEQWQSVQEISGGVQLMTLADPNAPPSKRRSVHRKRGQQFKSKGGRPKKEKIQPGEKARQRRVYGPAARRLKMEGLSLTAIQERIEQSHGEKVAKSTLGRWTQDV